jgi:hypothetical protein
MKGKENVSNKPPAAPDKSPKGLTWNQVSSRIEMGQRFRRPGSDLVIFGLAPVVYCQTPDGAEKIYHPTKDDLKATDWQNANAAR